jgi:hypothetical protein
MFCKSVNLDFPHQLILSRDVVLEFEYNDLPECDYWIATYKSSKFRSPRLKLVQGVNLIKAFPYLEFKNITIIAKSDYIRKNDLLDCLFFCE